MINTTMIFALDDYISLLYNELYQLRNTLEKILVENNDSNNREQIRSLITRRNLLNQEFQICKNVENDMWNTKKRGDNYEYF